MKEKGKTTMMTNDAKYGGWGFLDGSIRESSFDDIMDKVWCELKRATSKFGPFNSAHEGYAVIKEELEELWDFVKINNTNEARKEAVQVAAMAIRFLIDIHQIGGEKK